MIIREVRLLSFRAHEETRVQLAPKLNLISGPNGAGKTNLLEAIHYLCLTKSFLATRDTYALRKGAPHFEVEGRFEGERRPELRVRLAYVPSEGKRVFVNGAPLERLAELVGMLPLVVFAPQDQAITAEGPDERRRFVNNILSQGHAVYLDDLMKYRRALRQRNELLTQYRRRRATPSHGALLDSWNAELVALGSRVVARRHAFLLEFGTYLQRAYEHVEAATERPSIEYDTIAKLKPEDGEASIARKFEQRLEETAGRERERGTTLIGPQRDELVFRLNGMKVRRYASQGQHRTFGWALKLAQYFYLREHLGESPILLLDDVFDHLDRRRTEAFSALLQSDTLGQSLITTAQSDPLASLLPLEQPGYQALEVHSREGRAVIERRASGESGSQGEGERERGGEGAAKAP